MVLKVTTEWTGGVQGGPYFTTLFFGGTTQADADAAVAGVAAFWGAMDAELSLQISWRVLGEVEELDNATGNVIGTFATAGGSGAGVISSDPLPWATQGLLRWRTGTFVAGPPTEAHPEGVTREIRGRTFLPGMHELLNTFGKPTTDFVNFVEGLADNLVTAGQGAGSLVVYSQTKHVAAVVTSNSMWTQWANLRSRRD